MQDNFDAACHEALYAGLSITNARFPHTKPCLMREQKTELVLAVTIKFIVAPKTTMACRVAILSLMAVRRFS